MKNPIDLHVGQRLRHRRWMLGLTQQELAQAVGIKFQQIQKYESGINRMSASRLWDVANALGVSVSYFFEGLNVAEGNGHGPKPDVLEDKETLDLIRAYYTLGEQPRRCLLDLARAIGDREPVTA
ncbi:MAG: helix-turn-helix transcriptional regulator [Alphaproteobacteria bacterium]